jgi:hypothetical protein
MSSAALWILGRLNITQFDVLFLFHVAFVFAVPVITGGKSVRTAHCGIEPQCRPLSSEAAMPAVMMPLIFVRSAFSTRRIEIVGRFAVSATVRIFLRLLIAELHALLLFWHCVLTSCLWLLVSVS